jgi:hypothetical protein
MQLYHLKFEFSAQKHAFCLSIALKNQTLTKPKVQFSNSYKKISVIVYSKFKQ